jgi:hypothetical protein
MLHRVDLDISQLRRSLAPALAGLAVVLLACTRLAVAQTSQLGQWLGPFSWPLVASHAALLADGRVLLWSDASGITPVIWDPVANTFATVSQINTTVAGSAQSILADGDVAIVGGLGASGVGIQDAHRFDAGATSWTTLPVLGQGRNEPTCITLGDGRTLVVSGELQPGQTVDLPEIAPAGAAWSTLADAALALPRTPWLFLLGNGDVALTGPALAARRLDLSDQGSWSAIGVMEFGGREGGTAVLLPGGPDRILITGGHDPATETCEVLDLPTSSAWEYSGAMARARRHHNATLLPDGSVLVTGGTLAGDALDQAVYPAERYDPATGAWSTLASMTVPRRRGSIALLLPDGRVVCAGGGDGTPGSEPHANAEIFLPPYLFQGTRPTITSAPSSVAYDTSFDIPTPQWADVDVVWLVRGGGVTRGFNSDQRAVQLQFTATSGKITATAPADANDAPPGTYILFLVNGANLPSNGKVLRLDVGAPVLIPPIFTSAPVQTARVNAPMIYQPTATGTTPITWSLVAAPSWLGVSHGTGAVAGVPTATGNFNVTLRATNAAGYKDQSWVLVVTTGITPPRQIVTLGATWRYFKGTTNPGSTWATNGFDDSAWLSGPSGFGYGDNDDATVLSDMLGSYSTVYTRKTVQLYNVSTVTEIALLYDYDDGFVVYMNGTKLYSKNAPSTITNTSLATSSHEAIFSLTRQLFTDAPTRALLHEGTNVIAAVGLNQSLGNSDLTLKVVLEVTGGTDTPSDVGGEGLAAPDLARPNPFTKSTAVSFTLVRPGAARLDVYDVAGRRLRTLFSRDLMPGAHTLLWDGRDAAGQPASPGVYFYCLQLPGAEHRGKLTRAR